MLTSVGCCEGEVTGFRTDEPQISIPEMPATDWQAGQ